jgi:hypothetical protein
MTVRAKFTVTAITDRGGSMRTIELQPRYDTSIPEDQRFALATPWGEMRLGVDNPAALEQLTIGKAFYVDFTPAG